MLYGNSQSTEGLSMFTKEDERDSVTLRGNAMVNTKLFTEEDSDSTINACEFNRLWSEANRATREMRVIIDGMLLSRGISLNSSKENLTLVEKTKDDTRIIAFIRSITKMIAQKYITN